MPPTTSVTERPDPSNATISAAAEVPKSTAADREPAPGHVGVVARTGEKS
ncbi:hypothetical protein ACFWNN_44710 [Lentzea sp. NPDC058450]